MDAAVAGARLDPLVKREDRVKPVARPALRGVSHQYAALAALAAGVVLVALADGSLARFAAAVFAVSVVLMFGVSALYHRITWRPRPRRWMARADHASIYLLIAGTYTPFCLLALDGPWRITLLAIIWSGAFVATAIKFAWVEAPKALGAAVAVLLGWVGLVTLPQLIGRIGVAPTTLLIVGGALYTVGALVYALRRPNPSQLVFGYHEVFHAFVVAAVACHYTGVTIYLA
jgi:hemolysin III